MTAGSHGSRRTFVKTLGTVTALAALDPLSLWAAADTLPAFAFRAAPKNAIHVFSVSPTGAWTQTQCLPSAAPSALALSRDRRFLYAANGIETFNGLPTGSVEAYAISPHTGALTLLNRQPLALSATLPSHLAVSPNGRRLAVAAPGGATCNLLPLAEDGSIGRVTASIKSLASQTHFVAFHDDSTLLATDVDPSRTRAFTISDDGALLSCKHWGLPPMLSPPTTPATIALLYR